MRVWKVVLVKRRMSRSRSVSTSGSGSESEGYGEESRRMRERCEIGDVGEEVGEDGES